MKASGSVDVRMIGGISRFVVEGSILVVYRLCWAVPRTCSMRRAWRAVLWSGIGVVCVMGWGSVVGRS